MKRKALLVSFYTVIHLLITDVFYLLLIPETSNIPIGLIIYNIIWIIIAIVITSLAVLKPLDEKSYHRSV